jgi:hypothetical protein
MEIYYATAGECGLICPQSLSKKLRLICNTVKKPVTKIYPLFPVAW